MTTATASNGRAHLALGEIFSFAYDTFLSNKVRFALTALGMVIGTASLILVTTIGLTGKQYVLNQIQAIGANLVYAEYESGGERITSTINDSLTIDDMLAVQRDVSGIAAASPVVPLIERIPVGNGKERDLQILGVYPEYLQVRNLVVLAGRFFDKQDSQAHNKVGIVTQKLAEQLYGSQKEALGKTVKLNGLPFTIVGIFRERVDTFGQSEVSDNTMLIPYSVIRYFQDTPTVKQIYFSTTDASMVVPVTAQIQRVIQARHRPESVYKVEPSCGRLWFSSVLLSGAGSSRKYAAGAPTKLASWPKLQCVGAMSTSKSGSIRVRRSALSRPASTRIVALSTVRVLLRSVRLRTTENRSDKDK